MKNAILGCITLAQLKNALADPVVKATMAKYIQEETPVDTVAIDMVKRINFLPVDLKGLSVVIEGKPLRGFKTKVKKKLASILDIDVQELKALAFRFKHEYAKFYSLDKRYLMDVDFSKDNVRLSNLITLYKRLDDQYNKFEEDDFITSKPFFWELVIKNSLRYVKSKHFSPSVFSEEVLANAIKDLARDKRCTKDPYRELTLYMIYQFCNYTGRTNREQFEEIHWYERFMDALDKVKQLSSKFDQLSFAAQKKYVDQWVLAQITMYTEQYDDINLTKEVGYLRGDQAFDRFRIFRGKGQRKDTTNNGKGKIF